MFIPFWKSVWKTFRQSASRAKARRDILFMLAKASTWHMETPSRMMSFWATTRVFKTSVAAENCHTTAACSRQCALLEVQKADPKSLGSIWLNLFTDYSHVNPFAKFANKTAVFRHALCWNFTNGPESFSAITWRDMLTLSEATRNLCALFIGCEWHIRI